MNTRTHMQKAYIAWKRCDDLRERRLRLKRYTFGDQWGDITPVKTVKMSPSDS